MSRSRGKLIVGALIAAPAGSLAGAGASAVFLAKEGELDVNLIGTTMVLAIVGFLVSFIALLLIGIPLTWPFRNAIYRRPLHSAFLYGFIGAVLGLWVTVIVGLSGPGTLVPGMAIGAGTAVAWIAVMCRNRDWLG